MYWGLGILDLVILAGYFVIIAAIGVIASRFIENREDFVMGGRRFGKLMTLMFTFGAGTHADAAVGVASQCYKMRSLAGFWYQGVMIFTLPIYWLVSPIFRRARVLTTADFFERRYGTGFMLLYAAFALFILVAFSSTGLYGTAKLVEALTGQELSWKVAIPLIALVSFFYGIAGGLVATVWNDFFQGLLTIVMSLLIIPFFWSHIGGLAGFRGALADPDHAFKLVLQEGMTVNWIIMMSINTLLSMVVQPHIMANAGSAKSELDSRVGFIGGLILKRLMTIPWALTGVMALAMFGSGAIHPDHAFGKIARELLPAGCAGLMVACVLASVMDNISVFMVSFAGIYTNSIHSKLFPASSERVLLRINRLSALAFAAIVLPLSYAFTDVPQAMRFTFKTVPLMGIAFFLAVLWRRANRYGAMVSFVVAVAAMLYSQYQLGWGGDAGLPKTIMLYLSLGTLAGCVVSLLTPPEDSLRTGRFFLLLRTPIGQEQALRDAGLVEIPGTGTFEDPALDKPGLLNDRAELYDTSLKRQRRGAAPFAGASGLWHTIAHGDREGPLLEKKTGFPRPSKQTVYGFLLVGLISVALVGLVNLVAYWLEWG
jgi:SSS family solute:Na+ symporter